MAQAKKAFGEWLKGQSDETRFSLIHFHGDGRIAVPLGKNTRSQVQAMVEKLYPGGRTPISNCLKLALAQIKERRTEFSSSERHIVVVFTDGAESTDRRGNAGVVSEVATLTNEGIEVVGIGFHGEGEYLAPAVTQYYTADNAEQLRKGLERVSAEVDINVEFELTAEEEEKMKSGHFSSPTTTSSPESTTYSEPSSQKKKSPFSKFFTILILFIIIRTIIKALSKK